MVSHLGTTASQAEVYAAVSIFEGPNIHSVTECICVLIVGGCGNFGEYGWWRRRVGGGCLLSNLLTVTVAKVTLVSYASASRPNSNSNSNSGNGCIVTTATAISNDSIPILLATRSLRDNRVATTNGNLIGSKTAC